MKFYTKDSLISVLEKKTNFAELRDPDLGDGSIIVSEFGGRPLGIFPNENAINLFWVNPQLEDIIELNNRDIGGDRYWLSPERTFFYKKPERWGEWFCPDGLDPAYYNILKKNETSCLLKSEIYVTNQFSNEEYEGKVKREIQLIKEPIRTGLNYVGIHYRDKCVLFKSDLRVNGWSLATVISGGYNNPGTVLIPTKSNPKPLSYFRTIPKDRLKVGNNHIAFKIDVNDIYKLAIRPEDINYNKEAKIGYILKLPNSEEFSLLMKLSDDIPKSQNECFDVARDHPDSEIGVIQSYNSESKNYDFLRYGEIELQLKKFKNVNHNSVGISEHKLIAYIGPKNDILDTLEKYMGIENPNLF